MPLPRASAPAACHPPTPLHPLHATPPHTRPPQVKGGGSRNVRQRFKLLWGDHTHVAWFWLYSRHTLHPHPMQLSPLPHHAAAPAAHCIRTRCNPRRSHTMLLHCIRTRCNPAPQSSWTPSSASSRSSAIYYTLLSVSIILGTALSVSTLLGHWLHAPQRHPGHRPQRLHAPRPSATRSSASPSS